MSGIIEGYNYDIFISYRQKDNKGDREMSEFVVALKTELEYSQKSLRLLEFIDAEYKTYSQERIDKIDAIKERIKTLEGI